MDRTKFVLSPSQETLLDKLQLFANNDADVFLMKGAAGTGKTTVLAHYLEYLRNQKIYFKLMASTGTAAKVLANKTKSSADTIHGHIYVFSKNEEMKSYRKQSKDAIGLMKIYFAHNLGIVARGDNDPSHIWIIDESSMISFDKRNQNAFLSFGSGSLLSDIFLLKGNRKIIFIGDECQLQPFNEPYPKALNAAFLKKQYDVKVEEFQLREILRYKKNSGIYTNAKTIRNRISSKKYIKWFKLEGHNKEGIQLHHSEADMILHYRNTIVKKGAAKSIALVYSNALAFKYNKLLRSLLHNTNEEVTIGEVLIITQNSLIYPLVNGERIKVIELREKFKRRGLIFQNALVQEMVSGKEFEVLLDLNTLVSPSGRYNEDQRVEAMIDFSNRMKEVGIKRNTWQWNDKLTSDAYLQALKVSYGYVITIHKSQGGEWEEVFFQNSTKIYGFKPPSYMPLLYTAITRAREKLHLLDNSFIEGNYPF